MAGEYDEKNPYEWPALTGQVPVPASGVCRHCRVTVKREEYPDGTARWLHHGGPEPYWHCRTTVAGPDTLLTSG